MQRPCFFSLRMFLVLVIHWIRNMAVDEQSIKDFFPSFLTLDEEINLVLQLFLAKPLTNFKFILHRRCCSLPYMIDFDCAPNLEELHLLSFGGFCFPFCKLNV